MERLRFASSETYVEGIIVQVTDGGVTIDLKGRLGQLKVPLRMIITDTALEVGQEVGFLLSYPEVLEGPGEIDDNKELLEVSNV